MSEYMRRTKAQIISDNAFLDALTKDVIEPLRCDLRGAVPEYDEMPFDSRVYALVKLNSCVAGVGDSLAIETPTNGATVRFLAYAGIRIGRERVTPDGTVYVRPTFVDGAYQTDTMFENPLHGGPRRSLLDLFLHGKRIASVDTADGLTGFEELPLAYRVALVDMYVRQNVVLNQWESLRIILGVLEGEYSPEPHRAMYRTLKPEFTGEMGTGYGTVIILRDTMPSQKLMLYLAGAIRESRAVANKHYAEPHEEEGYYGGLQPYEPHHRTPREKTAATVAFIDSLIAQGYEIDGRAHGSKALSWNDVLARIQLEMGSEAQAYTDSESLRRSYQRYKQRHEEAL